MMKVYKGCCENDLETWQAFERVLGFTADGSLRWHRGRHRRLRKVPFSMPSYDHQSSTRGLPERANCAPC